MSRVAIVHCPKVVQPHSLDHVSTEHDKSLQASPKKVSAEDVRLVVDLELSKKRILTMGHILVQGV